MLARRHCIFPSRSSHGRRCFSSLCKVLCMKPIRENSTSLPSVCFSDHKPEKVTTLASSSSVAQLTMHPPVFGEEDAVEKRRQRYVEARRERIESLTETIFAKGNVFMKNVFSLEALPEGHFSMPEIAVIGMPSSGKSSLIEALLGNGFLGRKKGAPGTTKPLTFFNVGDAFALVDTPGYGAWSSANNYAQKSVRSEHMISLGILFQYLALRNKKNLRHVYWCMRAKKMDEPFDSPRHTELLRFLLYERIPFSIVMTRCDHFDDKPGDLVKRTEYIKKMMGNPKINVFHTAIQWENYSRITSSHGCDALRADMVCHICNGIPNKDLTYTKVHSLSYLPSTAAHQLEIERRYPRDRVLLPKDNKTTIAYAVNAHEQAKIAFAEKKRFEHGLNSMARIEAAIKTTMHNYKANISVKEREEQITQLIIRDLVLSSSSQPATNEQSLLLTPARPLQPQITSGPATDLLPSASDQDEHRVKRSALQKRPTLLGVDDEGITDGVVPVSSSGEVCRSNDTMIDVAKEPTFVVTADDALEMYAGDKEKSPDSIDAYLTSITASVDKPVAELTPYQQEILASGISPAFPFVLVPDSMLDNARHESIAKADRRSFEAFEKQQKGQMIEATYAAVGTFLTAGRQPKDTIEHGDEAKHAELAAPRSKSREERRHDKYLGKRPVKNHQAMNLKQRCPWLGAEKEARVVGLSPQEGDGLAKGGTMVPNLKEKGFGGKSHSVYTYKDRYHWKKRRGVGRWES